MLRTLAWFWGPVLVLLIGGGAVLQALGPPAPRGALVARKPANVAAASAVAPTVAAKVAVFVPPKPGTPIAEPDPALLELAKDFPDAGLPRIALDGRMPMRVYAAGYDPADTRPRVALLLADVGMRTADSEAAIKQLPASVSLAVSPYAVHPEALLAAARASGHETLVSIPMEPEKYPLNDPGNEALLTGLAPAVNQQRLEWVLSRIEGYVGATGALGPLHGERFAASEQISSLYDELARRGLLYIDPRVPPPGATAAKGARRAVDVVVDEPAVGAEIDANLARLERIARERGSAIGLVGRPAPVTTDRLLVWTKDLAARGEQLVPVSALVPVPPVESSKVSQ